MKDPKAMEIQKRYDYADPLHEQRGLHASSCASRSTSRRQVLEKLGLGKKIMSARLPEERDGELAVLRRP